MISLDENEVVRLYTEENKSTTDIAKKYDCSAATISRRLKKNNVKLRKNLDESKIVELYTEEKKSTPQIAEKFDCGTNTVARCLKRNGVKMRGNGGTKVDQNVTKKELKNLYIEEDYTQRELKEYYGYASIYSIQQKLNKFGISKSKEKVKEKRRKTLHEKIVTRGFDSIKHFKEKANSYRSKCSLAREMETDTDTVRRILNYYNVSFETEYSVKPNYNPHACKVIEQYGNKHGYDFQHAENGGERHIKKLNYFVDGYDEEKNVVVEADEPHHFRNGELRKEDKRRQKQIMNELDCKFIRLKLDKKSQVTEVIVYE
mgnify:CR=1 FL=1